MLSHVWELPKQSHGSSKAVQMYSFDNRVESPMNCRIQDCMLLKAMTVTYSSLVSSRIQHVACMKWVMYSLFSNRSMIKYNLIFCSS